MNLSAIERCRNVLDAAFTSEQRVSYRVPTVLEVLAQRALDSERVEDYLRLRQHHPVLGRLADRLLGEEGAQ